MQNRSVKDDIRNYWTIRVPTIAQSRLRHCHIPGSIGLEPADPPSLG
jgi:hypothetical protein